MVRKNNVTRVDTKQVLAAAVAVYRIQNNRVVRFENDIPGNKEMVLDILAGTSTIQITEDDQTRAGEIGSYLEQKIMLSTLTSVRVNDFLRQISELANLPEVPTNSIGQLVWAPKLYDDSVKQDGVKQDIGQFAFTSTYLGREKDKIEFTFNPIDVRYLSTYNCYRHVGHDGKGNLVTFLNKNSVDTVQRIRARIKSCEQSRHYANAKTTQINFVKVVG
jgi:hypothetical protein